MEEGIADYQELLCKTLPSGVKMPVLAYICSAGDLSPRTKALDVALQSGYRHVIVDGLQQNDLQAGGTLQKWLQGRRIKREEIFITVKVHYVEGMKASVRSQLVQIMYNLRCEYFDLVILQKNTPDKKPSLNRHDGKQLPVTWKVLESLVKEGSFHNLGVADFSMEEMEVIFRTAEIKPSVLMVNHSDVTNDVEECRRLQTYCKYRQLMPLLSLDLNRFAKSTGWPIKFNDLLLKYEKTEDQMIGRALLQTGYPIAISSNQKASIERSFKVLDFRISNKDFTTILSCIG